MSRNFLLLFCSSVVLSLLNKTAVPALQRGFPPFQAAVSVDNVDKSVNKSTSRRTWIRVNVENPDCGKRLQDAWEYHKKHREQSIFVKNA